MANALPSAWYNPLRVARTASPVGIAFALALAFLLSFFFDITVQERSDVKLYAAFGHRGKSV